MTAYLQPGDRIHIAYPSSGNAEVDKREGQRAAKAYATLGVVVVFASVEPLRRERDGDTNRQNPVQVVAVIRDPEGFRWIDPGQS